ncbi:MAG: hypothetical protein BAJATHORv1_100052 [Candidatus Thorarchaeota archaeon]|nr:MAG: hypothetical protein BAJATHORv1_100052 [Candidatus Thorarchaeota archaeon]
MIQPNQLVEQYIQLVSKPFQAMPEYDGLESVHMLYETAWVRILVIRSEEKPDCASIEVETSLPLNASRTSCDCDESKAAKELLDGMILHLKYMADLCTQGFQADLVGPDCLWTVSKEFNEIPSEDIFRFLCPPNWREFR